MTLNIPQDAVGYEYDTVSKTLNDNELQEMLDVFENIADTMYSGNYDFRIVDMFDSMLKNDANFKKMAQQFGDYRGDILTSDYECAAFVEMLYELGYLKLSFN